ncbi:SDR family oxidoreductase, partial [uncultured Mesotoga sp.]|uniref:SDR family NAD(P)-dependent oxidoreductase n=1 Tax=uncultured Mesotoga sp. TaxID=1184400 RepID=UPI002594C47B
ARTIIERGSKVVLTSRTAVKLEETVKGFSEENYAIIPWDLSDLDSLQDYTNKVKETVGPISGLVHCAGIQKTLPLSLVKEQTIFDVFNLNIFSAMLLVSMFSKNGYFAVNASFVLISSLAAHEGAMGKSIYAASKGAIEGFIPATASELAIKGIRLNAVIPGIVKTEMVDDFFKNLSDEQKKAFEDSYPLGLGDPIDVANLIEYLLSDKAKWITGECYKIDGGHMIRKA